MTFLFYKHCIFLNAMLKIVPNHTYPHIFHWCNPLYLMQLRCLKFCLVTSCNNYLCLGLLAFYHLLHPGFFGRVWTWLLMLSCECTSVYRLNLIMHNYYSYALLTTFWCIYGTSTNTKPIIIIVLNGEHQMPFSCNRKEKIVFSLKKIQFVFTVFNMATSILVSNLNVINVSFFHFPTRHLYFLSL